MLAEHQEAPISTNITSDQHAPGLHTQSVQSDNEHFRRILSELVDIGADLLRFVHQGAQLQAEYIQRVQRIGSSEAPPSSETTQEPSVAYDLICRAIRRNIALAQKLSEPAKAPAATKSNDRIGARKRIIRDVEDTIQRTTKDHEKAERLHAELFDRLDGPDLDDDIDDRPIDEIIADICRDLGIAHAPGTHPWKRRTPADIAILAARAAGTPPARASAAPKAPEFTFNAPNPPCPRTASSTGSDPP